MARYKGVSGRQSGTHWTYVTYIQDNGAGEATVVGMIGSAANVSAPLVVNGSEQSDILLILSS